MPSVYPSNSESNQHSVAALRIWHYFRAGLMRIIMVPICRVSPNEPSASVPTTGKRTTGLSWRGSSLARHSHFRQSRAG